jgi:HAE1 family hydrophobic/amphiphilic exporter-1
VGVILVVVLGVVAFTRMTTDLLPDMDLPYALVITTDVGASPEEVESDVTAPIEAAMATTSNIKNVSSSSYDNYSMVILEYEQNTNMDSILIEIQQELDQLEGSFPDTVGTPVIMQIDPDMMPVMVAAADVDGMTQAEISNYVVNELVPMLESVEGVASVSATGTLEESVQVTMDQDKIDALNQQILDKIGEKFQEAQQELDDGKDEITSGQKKLESGQNELASQLGEAQNEIVNGKVQAGTLEAETTVSLAALKETKTALETMIPELQKIYNEAVAIRAQIEALQSVQSGAAQQAADGSSLADGTGLTDEELANYMAQLEALNGQLNGYSGTLQEQGITLTAIDDIPTAINSMTIMLAQVNTGIATLTEAQGQISEGQSSLDDAYAALNESMINGILDMSEAAAQLADAENQLSLGQSQLDSARESAESSADLNQILTVDMLGNLLVAQNFSMPAGYVTEGDKSYMIRVGDKITSVEELQDVVLIDMGLDGIEPIRLSDVATVELVDNAAESYAKVNGNPGIMLSIEKQTGYSTGDVTDRVKEKFKSLEKTESGLHMTILMNQGVYIDIIVESVLENMIFGAILAIIVLILFLKDIKPTLIIACSIPLSVIFAVVLMYFTDISLNIISLSGLALGIGMLVDNSIVVIENIYRLRNQGYSIRKAAVEGASQVTGAIIASTLTTVCVFAPIIFTEGITRQLFVDIALTIAYTLTASLIVALTFVPMMSSLVLKKTKEIKHGFFEKVQDSYGKLMQAALSHKAIVFLTVVVLLAVSVVAALSRGFTFMDMDMETDQLTVTVSAKEDQILSFEELAELSDEIVERLSEIEGVDTIGAMIGGSSLLGGSSDSTTMYLILDEDKKVTNAWIIEQVAEVTADLACEVSTDSSASDMSSFLGSGISVQISGNNLDTLQELAAQVAALVEETEGTIDVEDGLDDTTPSLTIRVDKEKAAKYGMTTAQVYGLVYAKMASATAPTTISTDVKDYEVYVQSEEQSEVSLSDIRNLTFTYTSTDGTEEKEEEIPLSEIADFVEGISLNTIHRDSQTRYISVTAGIDDDHNVTLVSNQLQKKINQLEIPEGYDITMEGEDEMIMEAMQQMVLMLILAVIFIYLIMVSQFQSFLSPFIIMFTIPLAFTGGLFALFFTGNEVSVIAMIGFVMLAGIIVNNGIVMVDYINQLRQSGMSKKEAIIESGKTRLRPILMTALTTILAMSTMALGIGSGSEMMQPMAIVTVGGLVYGTLLTLIVVPCIYDAFNREKNMVEEEL